MRKKIQAFLILSLLPIWSIYFYKLTDSINDFHNFRQAQTLMTARVLAQERFNPFLPEIDFEGNPGIQVQEFPLYQILVKFFYSSQSAAIVAGRLCNILFSLLTAVYLMQIGRLLLGIRAGWIAAIMFLLAPFQVVFGRSVFIDLLAQLAGLGFFHHAIRFRHGGSGFHLFASVTWFLIGLFTKYSSMMVYAVPAGYALFNEGAWFRRNWKVLLPYLAICGLFLAWMVRASELNRAHTMLENMHGANAGMVLWNFGTLHQRLASDYYVNLAARLQGMLPGMAGVGLFLLGLLFHRPKIRIISWWMIGVAAYFMIWVNLNHIHEYYQLPVFPMLNLVAAHGLCTVWKAMRKFHPGFRLRLKVSTLLMICLVSGVMSLNLLYFLVQKQFYSILRAVPHYASLIKEKTSSRDIVGFYMEEHGNNPIYLYTAERRGIYLQNQHLYEPEKLKRFVEEKGMNIVVAVSQASAPEKELREVEKALMPFGFQLKSMEFNWMVFERISR